MNIIDNSLLESMNEFTFPTFVIFKDGFKKFNRTAGQKPRKEQLNN